MNAALCSVLIAAVLASTVNAHGQMMEPAYRPVTDKYRADCGALKSAGNDELQWAPLENLSQRKQADMPQAATFDIMNGCRGMVYEASNPVTALQAGVEFPVKWFIQAPHPGYGEFNIVKPKTDANGKITYEKVVTLKRIEDFATSGGNFDDKLTIPSSVTGCEKAGACALQMYWHSDIASQTYPTCADITIGGSGGSSPATGDASEAASNDASAAASDAEATDAPAETTDAPEAADSAAGDADESATPAPATTAPADDEYSTPAPTKKKCTGKVRSLRRN
ncbi:Chitin-binding protein, partial [Globisporangium splendens]